MELSHLGEGTELVLFFRMVFGTAVVFSLDPLVFIPALLVGWLCRDHSTIAASLFAIAVANYLGAMLLYGKITLAPPPVLCSAHVLASFALGYATFAAARWWEQARSPQSRR